MIQNHTQTQRKYHHPKATSHLYNTPTKSLPFSHLIQNFSSQITPHFIFISRFFFLSTFHVQSISYTRRTTLLYLLYHLIVVQLNREEEHSKYTKRVKIYFHMCERRCYVLAIVNHVFCIYRYLVL